eukprot:Em0006g592a
MAADLIFIGGEIITLNDKEPVVEALAIKANTIVAAGREDDVLQLRNATTKLVDLKGQALMPGFIAAHTHPFLTTSLRYFTDISPRTHSTSQQVFATMRESVGRLDPAKSEWAVFYGYDECLVQDLPALDAGFIDINVSATVPVLIISVDVDNAWFNRRALAEAGVAVGNVPSLGPGREFVVDKDGQPTGHLRNPAMYYIMQTARLSLTDEAKKDLYREHFREYARSGFTTVVDLGSNDKDTIKLGLEVAHEDGCPVRLARYVVPLLADANVAPSMPDPSRDRVWIAGVKFWADGDAQSGTMALNEEYLDTDFVKRLGFPPHHRGRLTYTSDALREMMEPFHRNGWQISTHANGDRCVSQVLDTYRALLAELPRPDHRYRMEHVGLITHEQLGTAAEMGVTPSFLVDLIYYYGKSLCEDLIGPERGKRLAPLSSAQSFGHKFSIHEDSPLFPLTHEPFRSIATAVSRKTKLEDGGKVLGSEYRISAEHALKACTINAAWQIFCERSLGTLEVGKVADMVVLSHNPLTVPCECIELIKVQATYMNGQEFRFV